MPTWSGSANQDSPRAGPQQAKARRRGRSAPARLPKRADGIVEEHHAEARDDEIMAAALEPVGLGVAANQPDVGVTALQAAPACQRAAAPRCRSRAPSRGRRPRRRAPRGGAAAAADVDHALAGADARARHQQLGQRREPLVERRLTVDPGLCRNTRPAQRSPRRSTTIARHDVSDALRGCGQPRQPGVELGQRAPRQRRPALGLLDGQSSGGNRPKLTFIGWNVAASAPRDVREQRAERGRRRRCDDRLARDSAAAKRPPGGRSPRSRHSPRPR